MAHRSFALSVKALVRDDRGRCLVIRRSPASKNNAGKWDFPGGKVDAGESFDVALVREIREETGIEVELEKTLGAAQSEMPALVVVYLFLQARVVSGEVRLSGEHDGFEWMTASKLAGAAVCPQFVDFVRSLSPATVK
jgi:8-oxo-dGTP diphosphatase